MTAFDIGLLGTLLYNGFQGYKKGFVQLIFELLAICLGFYVSFVYLGTIKSGISSLILLEEPVLSILAFIVGFGSLYILTHFVGKWLDSLIKALFLGPVNTLLGFFLGIFKGVLLFSPVFIILVLLQSSSVTDSVIIGPYFEPIYTAMSSYVPEKLLTLFEN